MKYKDFLKELVPPILVRLIKNNRSDVSGVKPLYYCPICKKEVSNFNRLPDYYLEEMDKHQFIHSIFSAETLNLLNYSCPHCGCSDRARLYSLYLNEQIRLKQNQNLTIKLLDVAPDKILASWIRQWENIEYRSVDLYMPGVDDVADITDLNIYEDGKFDIIICSHVLEHINDDRRAISELHRILKDDGFALIMVPIFLSLSEDFESDEIKTSEERWKYYGQDDHVRAYSKSGFTKKLEGAGFSVQQLGVDYFGKEQFEKCGVHSRSVLYIVNK